MNIAIEQVVRKAASDLPMVRATMSSALALGPVADELRTAAQRILINPISDE